MKVKIKKNIRPIVIKNLHIGRIYKKKEKIWKGWAEYCIIW